MSTAFNEADVVRDSAGKFGEKQQSAPEVTLAGSRTVSVTVDIPAGERTCTECDARPASYRFANVPRGYRTNGDSVFCPLCAAEVAGNGSGIERIPVNDGVTGNVWVIEGDDHEVELVEADTVEEAIHIAADRFVERYGDDDEDGNDYDPADLLTVVGNFRGDIDDTDSLVFVPIEGAEDESAACRALDNY